MWVVLEAVGALRAIRLRGIVCIVKAGHIHYHYLVAPPE